MTMEYPAPRAFAEWLHSLQRHQIGLTFNPATAAWLRVSANTKDDGIFFASGTGCIPYVDWLTDGMSMNNRLILHLQNHANSELDSLIQQHFSVDIRVATHYQDLGDFLSDISHHRLDYVLVDLNEVKTDMILKLLDMLSTNGLLVSYGPSSLQEPLGEILAKTCFCAPLHNVDNGAESFVFTKKAPQHLAVRRGGRRRHSGTEVPRTTK